jgi:DNA-binding beta-propeller fold protein YncE
MFARISCWFSIIMFSCLYPFLLTPETVHADGGAPNRAYIAGATKGIGIIDLLQQKVSNYMAVAGDPHMILLSLNGSYLYAAEPQLQRVAVIVAATGATVCTAPVPGHPTLLAMDNATILFVASNDASSVTEIDPESCHILHLFQLNEPVYGMGVAPVGTSFTSGNQLWVATSTELAVFDDGSNLQIKQIPIPGGPRSVSIPPGSAVYVTTQQGSVVTVDLNTYTVRTVISGGSYSSMDFDENTGEVYVPDQKSNQLVVLRPVNPGFALPQEPLRTIPLEAKPVSVAVTSDGQLALVALEDGKVAMCDIPAHQITNTFDIGGSPHFIITGLNPPLLTTTTQQTQTSQQAQTPQAILVIVLLLAPIILFIVANKSKMHEPNLRRR